MIVRRAGASLGVLVLAVTTLVITPSAHAALEPECSADFEGAEARCELAAAGFPISVSASYTSGHSGDHLVIRAAVYAVAVDGNVARVLLECEGDGHTTASCSNRQYGELSALPLGLPDDAVTLVCAAQVEIHRAGHAHSHAPGETQSAGQARCASGAAAT